MKYTIWIITALMLISIVAAQEAITPTQVFKDEDRQTIEMRTIDFFIIQFEVKNVNQIDYRNCVPYLDNVENDEIKGYMTFTPEIHDLPPNAAIIINGRLDNVPVGYYKFDINTKCDKYYNNEIIETGKILNPEQVPKYEVLITPAGTGQNYVFIPVQSYNFVSKSGQTETATFTIANTGMSALNIDITPEPTYQDIIKIEPRQTTIPANDRTQFRITISVPQGFTELNTNLTIKIGDYTENFPINGEKETLGLGGTAVTQNLFTGTISAGNIKIPTWSVVLAILIAGYFLFKPKKKGGKK